MFGSPGGCLVTRWAEDITDPGTWQGLPQDPTLVGPAIEPPSAEALWRPLDEDEVDAKPPFEEQWSEAGRVLVVRARKHHRACESES